MSKSAATLVIHRASEMTPKGRENIAKWLRKQGAALINDGHLYSKITTIKYLYKEK
jgi:hypothetical protein